ncbi:hypothetical protein E3P92_00161 [Wallemia ichthyophaga]|uniref:S1 motif domain-containing protein n=2 Tax=Wallemia ichthyophaga TaxID=245174 RepID=A0A4T0F860_WALIC|nr:Exosome complex component rrp4 [Wallemia ichthyophaga EXF-994]TIA84042.1 hypothetical protein E3P98_00302 [Wallemia ichthyophaga]EOR04846.1 Exosome complex component rrp4 [Wallemia ichthyophaga EXF-994]TIB00669.1 hypothetical protein E3P95_01626 [Wallemia ichthyophaga]TIB01017.1 hypothetical protein E3P94_02012 [Wallemia ichthyophaga]TIB05145.1 hypothetical protein E3P96_01385 [Wallemia ichthyophaga]
MPFNLAHNTHIETLQPADREEVNDADADIEMDDDDSFPRSKLTSPGDVIASSSAYMHGHGTYVHNDNIVSNMFGTVERVNKLVSVRPLKHKYIPQVGDLVIGRIVEVQAKRWKVDIHSSSDAVLMLSSINLPGGVQRRKLESDELQMRNFFTEGDLCVAEVQSFFHDGSVSLHTRSLKYGKLRNGTLATVPPNLMRRLKSHFYTLPVNVDLIIGLNGSIWVSMHDDVSQDLNLNDDNQGFDSEGVYNDTNDSIDSQTRESINRTAIVIDILASHRVPLTDTLIATAYDVALDLEQDNGIRFLSSNEDVQDELVHCALQVEESAMDNA